jgi:hypothetical protein
MSAIETTSPSGVSVERDPIDAHAGGDAPPGPPNSSTASTGDVSVTVIPVPAFPYNLSKRLELIRAHTGKAHSIRRDKRNPHVLPVGSRALNNIIREIGRHEGHHLRQSAIGDINHYLQAEVDMKGVALDIWYRVAPVEGGIEIDLGDDDHNRVRITPGKVDVISAGSRTLFWRTASCRPMTMPAEVGNLDLLKKHVHLNAYDHMLLVAWITWTLAHPKVATSKFLILLLQGGEGTGKSVLSKLLLRLIDPGIIGVQPLHGNAKDFAIAAQNGHVLAYDNLRHLSHAMADLLCTASTGGSISSRQLYTDSEQNILHLQVALILNGIPAFVDQPDLAQRCLPLRLNAIPDAKRKTESEMAAELEKDLPAIQRGLFDLIAKIFVQLPNAKVTSPTRMLDFSTWLAAMELVYGAPYDAYQDLYREALQHGQRDALLDNNLAAAMLDFAETQEDGTWSGRPAELLNLLNFQVAQGTQRSRNWPGNPIALSKRLLPLQAGLRTQGVAVELSRAKERTITINKTTN